MIKWLLCYLAVISLISFTLTCYDKWAAKHRKSKRTPEASLLLLSALGGSAAMYITMKLIKHKTKHKKFMVGIPAIFIIQVLLGILIYKFIL